MNKRVDDMADQSGSDVLLKRIDILGREIERLRRDLLRYYAMEERETSGKPTLFGSVRGGDVTEEMVEEARQSLWRSLKDL